VRMPVFCRTKRWLLLCSCLLLFSILFAACGENSPSILDTHGPIADSEGTVFWVILGIATFVFLAVEGALIFSIARYRERPDMGHPRQIHGSTKLELLWTVIPTIFLVVILVFTIRGLLQVAPESEPADANKVTVTAIGHQWWWEFYYPKYGISTADTLEIPTNTVVHVDLFSNNVIHSFWVPQLTGKTDVVPGHNNAKWFKANDPGTYEGICAEYCGTQHANMKFNVKAVDPNTYMTWIHTQQQAALSPATTTNAKYSPADGLAVFQQNCVSCHGIVGVDETKYNNIQANCNTSHDNASDCPLGPNLTHFGSRDLIAGGVLTNNKDQCDPNDPNILQHCNLAKWLHDPQGIKPGNDMAIGQLSDTQIRDLVAYLESLN
jgi:cytochrome c oxidase subunit 2